MRLRTATILTAILFTSAPSRTQEVNKTATPTVIRTETRVVLVDSVVTDKKGNYVTDLTQKDFKVYEDNKEQPITSFTYEADPKSPLNNQKHYLVLFFDNASVSMANQMNARNAAQKFVDTNTGPNKYIAIANFSGSLQITQNFTNDPDRLRAVIGGAKTAHVDTSDAESTAAVAAGGPTARLSAPAEFGIRSVLLALRSLAKGLQTVPGRKMVVMLSEGFPMNAELQSEMTATIDACNKANVSVYPVDVRGLATNVPGMQTPGTIPGMPRGGRGEFGFLKLFSSPSLASFSNSFQARGGGGAPGGGGGTGGGGAAGGGAGGGARGGGGGAAPGGGAPLGGAGGTRGGNPGGTSNPGGGRPTGVNPGNNPGNNPGFNRGGGPMNPNVNNPMMRPTTIMPTIPPDINANQQALYMLANGTGGFVIVNTNDLLGGMEKIAREQDQYYIIGFTPPESAEGSCHTLKVKVGKGESVRSRSGYCNVRQVDVLAGKPAETELEAIAMGQAAGKLGAPLQLPFFYASPNVARVNVAMEIPSSGFKFEKVKGKMHAEMNVLGIAYRADNSVAAKFSDTLKFDYENKVQMEEFAKKPVHYESQFDIASGQYNFRVVFSAGGDNFGKIEKPLVVEPFDGKQFAMSAVAMGTLRKVDHDESMDAVLIEDKVPLVASRVQAIPSGQYVFNPAETTGAYLEIYDPALTGEEKPPTVLVNMKITDRKTGQQKFASGNMDATSFVRKGNSVVPVVMMMPFKDLPAGSYRLDVACGDTSGKSMARTIDFELGSATTPAVGWDKN